MVIKSTCIACGKTYSFPDRMNQKKVTCTECKKKFRVVSDSDRLEAQKKKSIKCTCPDCGRPLTVPGDMYKQKIRCPACKAKFPAISNSERLKILEEEQKIDLMKKQEEAVKEERRSAAETIWEAEIDKNPKPMKGHSLCSICSRQIPDHFFGMGKAISISGQTFCIGCAPLKICPRCAETVQNPARVCWHCGLNFVAPGIEEVSWTWFVASAIVPFAGVAFPIAAILQGRKGGCILLFVFWIINLIYSFILFYMLTPSAPPG
ncbi:MAG: hypothetical protein E3J72_15485 [Planctomycetota bacterium]|nr:MAG: hypothetical protein E3J72_15485 [Planctomycetota bacterium]